VGFFMASFLARSGRRTACAALVALAGACSNKQVVVGEQCPGPYSGHATLAKNAGKASVFGTSCAPCKADSVRLDKNGCPIFVTFGSCGGDICVGDLRISPPPPNAGMGEQDAGWEGDAGGGEEDGGAR
jgi:hypothetical protein